MKRLRPLLRLGLAVYGLALLATIAEIALYRPPDLPQDAAAIIVLSGGTGPVWDKADTAQRVRRGVALWQAGAAPLIVFTGAIIGEDGTNQSDLMQQQAIDAGVPKAATRLEPNSYSTLQNALFTKALLGPEITHRPVIIVTHRFHLLRAWASFRWAGFTDLTLVAADQDAAEWPLRGILYEGIKWPGNILRAGVASLALRLHAPSDDVIPLLH